MSEPLMGRNKIYLARETCLSPGDIGAGKQSPKVMLLFLQIAICRMSLLSLGQEGVVLCP